MFLKVVASVEGDVDIGASSGEDSNAIPFSSPETDRTAASHPVPNADRSQLNDHDRRT